VVSLIERPNFLYLPCTEKERYLVEGEVIVGITPAMMRFRGIEVDESS